MEEWNISNLSLDLQNQPEMMDTVKMSDLNEAFHIDNLEPKLPSRLLSVLGGQTDKIIVEKNSIQKIFTSLPQTPILSVQGSLKSMQRSEYGVFKK